MDLIYLVLAIAIAGFIIYAVTHWIPMDPPFKVVIYVIVCLALILFVMRQFAGTVPNVLR